MSYSEFIHYLPLLTIPFVSGFVGWFTNMVALKMLFYPYQYVGIPGFWKIPPILGWRGIIPRKAQKMAAKATRIITTRLIPTEELYSKLDPQIMSRELLPVGKKIAKEFVEETAPKINKTMWNITPQAVKVQITNQVKKELPGIFDKVLSGIKTNIYNVIDLEELVISKLTGKNVGKLVEVFLRCGGPEFKFIEISGLYFGFLFGIIQMGIFVFFNKGWTLPIAGVIVGYATNWLAIQMIFRPMHPKKFGPFSYHGLFHKRQDEVSKEYANLVGNDILSARNIMNHILYRKTADDFFNLVEHHLLAAFDKISSSTKPIVSFVFGDKKYDEIRKFIVNRLSSEIPRTARALEDYVNHTLKIEKTVYERLRVLPAEEFEEILRSAFQEDEILLILVGAALGFMAGFAQWMLFFN